MNDIDQAVQVHQPGLGKPRFVIGDMFYRDFKFMLWTEIRRPRTTNKLPF